MVISLKNKEGHRSFIVFKWWKQNCFRWTRIIFVVWSARVWGALKALHSKHYMSFRQYTKRTILRESRGGINPAFAPLSSSSLRFRVAFANSYRCKAKRELVIREKSVFRSVLRQFRMHSASSEIPGEIASRKKQAYPVATGNLLETP